MTVTALYFFCFLFVGVIAYYIAPKKVQWFVLLILSLAYYFFAATPYTILFLLASAFFAYISTAGVFEKGKNPKTVVVVTICAILLNVLVWFLLKGSSFWKAGVHIIQRVIPSFPEIPDLPVAAALGMGYYTAQIIGYILDCYWGICEPQKNFLKLFLFTCFFPQLTVGPISKYPQLECLYEGHRFSIATIAHGTQRILWGLFKKLVISDRIAIIVTGIWGDTLVYHGIYPWLAVFLYPLEIYTDFSGCMDIVLGAAELFGIQMPENFHNPFFSWTCQEFWQRWHITLGVWAKDHVYYPVLKSRVILGIGVWAKKHFNKNLAKKIPWIVGMGVLWFIMGFWHGSSRHIFGVSLWFWAILVLGELFSPLSNRITHHLGINAESFSWHLFQSLRTYILYSLGCVFFSADTLMSAFGHVKILIQNLNPEKWNPWIFWDGSILKLGISHADLNVVFVSLLVVLISDSLSEKYGSTRAWLDRQILPFRWAVYIALFVAVAVFGMYGEGYNASEFIYGQF